MPLPHLCPRGGPAGTLPGYCRRPPACSSPARLESQLIDLAAELCGGLNRPCYCAAYTASAADRLNALLHVVATRPAQTLHKTFNLRGKDVTFPTLPEPGRRVCLCVDKISMLNAKLVDCIRLLGATQQVDLLFRYTKQLPPVGSTSSPVTDLLADARWRHYHMERRISCVCPRLEKILDIMRGDVPYDEDFEIYFRSRLTDVTSPTLDETYITHPNIKRNEYNASCLALVEGRVEKFKVEVGRERGIFDWNSQWHIHLRRLKPRCRVMGTDNCPVINGKVYTYLRVDDETGTMHLLDNFTGEEVETGRASYRNRFAQFPVTLAYAMTVHKSHGHTLDKIRVDVATVEPVEGALLVACSRVRRLDDLVLEMEGQASNCDLMTFLSIVFNLLLSLYTLLVVIMY